MSRLDGDDLIIPADSRFDSDVASERNRINAQPSSWHYTEDSDDSRAADAKDVWKNVIVKGVNRAVTGRDTENVTLWPPKEITRPSARCGRDRWQCQDSKLPFGRVHVGSLLLLVKEQVCYKEGDQGDHYCLVAYVVFGGQINCKCGEVDLPDRAFQRRPPSSALYQVTQLWSEGPTEAHKIRSMGDDGIVTATRLANPTWFIERPWERLMVCSAIPNRDMQVENESNSHGLWHDLTIKVEWEYCGCKLHICCGQSLHSGQLLKLRYEDHPVWSKETKPMWCLNLYKVEDGKRTCRVGFVTPKVLVEASVPPRYLYYQVTKTDLFGSGRGSFNITAVGHKLPTPLSWSESGAVAKVPPPSPWNRNPTIPWRTNPYIPPDDPPLPFPHFMNHPARRLHLKDKDRFKNRKRLYPFYDTDDPTEKSEAE